MLASCIVSRNSLLNIAVINRGKRLGLAPAYALFPSYIIFIISIFAYFPNFSLFG